MNELFKTTRIVQRTVLAVSLTILAFFYPLQSSAPIKKAYEEIFALGHVFIDLQSDLHRYEDDIQYGLFTDLELLLGGPDARLIDQSRTRWSDENPSDYIFIEVGDWVRERDGLRFADILSDWNSDERTSLAVYEYRREELTNIVGPLLGRSEKTYALERVRRSHNDSGIFLELTFRAQGTDKAKTFSVPLYDAAPLDVRKFFREHPKSAQVIVDGELCPALQGMATNIQGVELEQAQVILASMLPDSPEKVSFMGITVDVLGVALFAPPILLGLFFYLGAHLRRIPRLVRGLSAEERTEALRFPWTPLYEGWLNRVIEIISMGILPVAAMAILVFSQPPSIASKMIFQIVVVLEALAIAVLAALTIRWAWAAGKSLRQSDAGADARSKDSLV